MKLYERLLCVMNSIRDYIISLLLKLVDDLLFLITFNYTGFDCVIFFLLEIKIITNYLLFFNLNKY